MVCVNVASGKTDVVEQTRDQNLPKLNNNNRKIKGEHTPLYINK